MTLLKTRRVEKDDWSKLWIAKINGWTISATGDQHVLGSLILFPPRKFEGSLADLTDMELIEFKNVAKLCEQILKTTFESEWFNYSQAGNVVKSLHIHLMPRYSDDKDFQGYTFTDKGWGRLMEYRKPEELPDKDIVFAIVAELKRAFEGLESDLSIEVF